MSIAAEYAAALHKKEAKNHSHNTAFTCDLSAKKLDSVKVAIFDIYGTLINFCPVKLANDDKKKSIRQMFF